MENTEINKVKFFAQYWGQKVFINPVLSTDAVTNVYIFDYPEPEDIEHEYLELKHISSITDEDASILAEDYDFYIGSDPLDQFKTIIDFKQSITENNCYPIGFFDFLRSKGYALPWMGLSVENLEEYGWIKLKKQTKL